ncbi:MAG: 3-hydroxyacyl-CoA dehydrogenase family protein [Gammaproteobacteria bacterium]|nr:3-hydroxyacyl-CoA dehydrogenase family protein [Gammaproteobacteria bacterium]
MTLGEQGLRDFGSPPRPVHTVGVVGAGTMGRGIAIALAGAGFATVLVDSKPGAATKAADEAQAALDAAVAKGRLERSAAMRGRESLRAAESLEALAACELVIEAVFESLPVKQAVFGELGCIARVDAVLATNTSTLDIDVIGAASGRPADVVGMHFFSPANVMRLVEIVRGARSSAAALATVADVTGRLGKIGVEVGNAFGFVGNRMLYAYGRERELLMLEGATPTQVDLAMEAFGMAMGPNAVGDLSGLDVGVSARRQWRDRPRDPRYFRVSEALVERGWLGRKSGRGFYRYVEGRRVPDREVEALIRDEATRLGIVRRSIDDQEIVERCVLALVNEGARLIGLGIARCAADVDVIWCHGYGFPRTRGGPMHFAATRGWQRLAAQLSEMQRRTGDAFWEPAPWIVAQGSS